MDTQAKTKIQKGDKVQRKLEDRKGWWGSSPAIFLVRAVMMDGEFITLEGKEGVWDASRFTPIREARAKMTTDEYISRQEPKGAPELGPEGDAMKRYAEEAGRTNQDLSKGGVKFDTGKDRFELLPGDALWAIARVLTLGAKKYSDRNWEKGMHWSRPFGALMRHMWAWWQGQGPTNHHFLFGDLDDELKVSHLWCAGCCMVFLISFELRGIGDDDRPRPFGPRTVLE